MAERMLRKANSDASVEIKRYKDLEIGGKNVLTKIDEVLKQAECECCGMKEECTAGYIDQVEDSFSGKWVCGLCSEAVKDNMTRAPDGTAVTDAVNSHRDVCQKYKSTRLNPKLSFTLSMRDIAKKSSDNRSSSREEMTATSTAAKLGRRSSCGPRFDFKQYM